MRPRYRNGFRHHFQSCNTSPLCVEGKEDRNRALHSKSIVLESENNDLVMMMIGSSNFTPRGMGVDVHNCEANLVFEDVGSVKRRGLHLIDRLGLPRAWNEGLELDEVVWQTPEAPPEDEPDPRPSLPAFFAWATFSQVTGEITLGLDRHREQPNTWSVRLPGTDADALTLFARHVELADPLSGTVTYALPVAMHTANIVALLVEWYDDVGELRQAKLGVTAEGAEHLLPPTQFQTLNADTIIECLIGGKTPSQWIDQYKDTGELSGSNDAAIESLRSVDTSSFLLYRVRRFGRALTGMSHRIMRTILQPDAIRYRMLNDPFGPISLAHSIARATEDDDAGWCAKIDDECRLFCLVEILLTVVHLQARLTRKVKGKERKAIGDICSMAIQQSLQCAESVKIDDRTPERSARLPGPSAKARRTTQWCWHGGHACRLIGHWQSRRSGLGGLTRSGFSQMMQLVKQRPPQTFFGACQTGPASCLATKSVWVKPTLDWLSRRR